MFKNPDTAVIRLNSASVFGWRLESLPELPDIVDVFRAALHVLAIVESCMQSGIKILWLQEGVIHEVAAMRAQRV